MRVSTQGYLEVRISKGVYKNWWLYKGNVIGITLPKNFVGERIRFKLEVIEDGEGHK